MSTTATKLASAADDRTAEQPPFTKNLPDIRCLLVNANLYRVRIFMLHCDRAQHLTTKDTQGRTNQRKIGAQCETRLRVTVKVSRAGVAE
jgi:hypothetical protein